MHADFRVKRQTTFDEKNPPGEPEDFFVMMEGMISQMWLRPRS